MKPSQMPRPWPPEGEMETKPTTMRLNPLDHVARLENLKVEQWVYHSRHRWVQVAEIDRNSPRPILVRVRGNYDSNRQRLASFTGLGKVHELDENPSLFTVDIFNGTPPPEPDIDWSKVPQGTNVEVAINPDAGWCNYPRQFVAYYEGLDRPYIVYLNGPGGVFGVEQYAYCRLAVPAEKEWLK